MTSESPADSPFSTREVLSALYELMNESSGGRTYDEMHPDTLIPQSIGYGWWFCAPAQLPTSTAGLSLDAVVERIERRIVETRAR